MKYKCWCCLIQGINNEVEIEDELCNDCSLGICEAEKKYYNGEGLYV